VKFDKKTYRGEPPNFSGQHFLHHPGILDEIVNCVHLGGEDTVLELGAGKGALTTRLMQKAGSVLAVEYDAKLVDHLAQKTSSHSNVKIIRQDIIKIRLPQGKFAVVSNIPYALTTPIMKMLLDRPSSGFQKGVIVMEKGAARRFTSKAIRNDYVLCWKMWFELRYVKTVPRECFSPPPRVESAIVVISRKTAPIVPYKECAAFRGLAEWALRDPAAAFEAALRGLFTRPQLKQLRRNIGLDPETPVSMLSEVQWGGIFNAMSQFVPRHLWPGASRNQPKGGASRANK
jgi:23S rRNA (adenine-N6)-dimethyltransferase